MKSDPLAILDYDELPPLSELICERTENGLTISIPCEGFQRLVKRMCRTPRFWLVPGVMLLVNAFPQVIRIVRQLPATPTLYSVGNLVGMSSAIAFGICIGIWISGRRSAKLILDGQQLRLHSRGYFSTRTQTWAVSAIKEIRENGMCVELLSVRAKGSLLKRDRKFRLLCGRDARELVWVARTLRDAMAITPISPNVLIESP